MDQEIIVSQDSHIDVAIKAWLESKFRLSGSQKTRKAYEDTLTAFRSLLRQTGHDLDPFMNIQGDTEEARRAAVAELALAAQGFITLSAKPGRLVAASTYNQRISILGSFYAFAIKRGFFKSENPIAKLDRARSRPYQSSQAMDPEDVKERMAAIDRSTRQGARDWVLLAILLQTGRRLSEVVNLRWRHVQISKDSKVTLVFEHCKGGKTMRDTLPAPIATALFEYLRLIYGEPKYINGKAPLWVSFTRRSAKQGDSALPPPLTIRSVANICQARLGTSKVHVTRHTWAHAMENAGAKTSEIQARLGHESLATTGRYLAALKQDNNPQAADIADIFGLT